MQPISRLGYLALLSTVSRVSADFGDYVDPTFNCPAMTTCPVVCVAEGQDCPDALLCEGLESKCLDGTCAMDCTEADAAFLEEDSPCPECSPVVCGKIIDDYDTCNFAFGSYYEATNQCAEEQEVAETKLFTLREPLFMAIYCIVCISFALMFMWCAFNQRLSPVPGSTQPLLPEKNGANLEKWTQSGYRAELFGMSLYALIMSVLFGFQVALGALTIFYYIQQEAITWFKPVFEDELQVLLVHEITWAVGLFFTLLLKWPVSIQALFLRRSSLASASHVIVVTPITDLKDGEKGTRFLDQVKSVLTKIGNGANSFMRCIFSDVSFPVGSYERTVCKVKIEGGIRHFYFRLRRYNFDEETGVFIPGRCSLGSKIGDFIEGKAGLTANQASFQMKVVGQNYIYMKKPNFFLTIMKEFSKPFYIYQLFMIWTWFPLWYYYMACVQTIIVGSGGLVMSFFQYRNEKNLYRITMVEGEVTAIRDGESIRLNHKLIVPGDVIVIEPGYVYADLIVLESTHLLVDEAALTGESTPMSKISLDLNESADVYAYVNHKKHTISAGTRVIEANDRALAFVLATGSHTTKGELLRDILSYQRHQFKFDTEVKIVILILFLYSIFGFSMTVGLLKDDIIYEFFYGMYVVGTCLPPLLPTVFTVSVGISDDRLARKNIACVNSEDILVAGKVKMVFFDKTGTLTTQGLDFISASEGPKGSGKLDTAMAICHSLTSNSDGMLIGNAVDLNMFNASLAKVVGGSLFKLKDGSQVHVLKIFEFDHHRMTQSVVVEHKGKCVAFVKGSGESISKLCKANTMPVGFDDMLASSAREGIYQISFGTKELSIPASEVNSITRDSLEYDLEFVGTVNFKNQLRDESVAVIEELTEGDICSTMVTGDNTLTGICIAKEAGLIKAENKILFGKFTGSDDVAWLDEENNPVELPLISEVKENNIALAVTGEVWRHLLEKDAENASALAAHIRVFGRCTPNDKVSVIDFFVREGNTCCMVGDGGNDCGALKTAHVGIALSDAEASIVAPFTSLDKQITSVAEVLREGRCALASALASYNYMIIYGQVESINQIANAYFSVTFHEWCWVFMDGVWMMSMAFTLPLARAEKRLSSRRPTSSLLGMNTMATVLGVLIINFCFTCIALGTLTVQDWYQCRKWGSTDISNITLIGDNYEASVLFIITGYQYVSSAMAFNWGFSFRSTWWKNYVFVTLCIGYTVIHWIATLHPSQLSCVWRLNCTNENVVPAVTDSSIPINNAFNTTLMPVSFRVKLLIMMIFNTFTTMIWTYLVGNGSKIFRSKKSSNFAEG